MTVNQLIKCLSQLPPDATVYTEDGEGHTHCVITKVVLNTEMMLTKCTKKVTLFWSYDR